MKRSDCMGAASNKDRFRVPPPKSIKEVPDYLKKTVGATFSRLFYIFRLVWETQPFSAKKLPKKGISD